MSGCVAISQSRTEAPISSASASASRVCRSRTRFRSINTGGVTMPRRIFTTRSVPPPSGLASGNLARAAIASSSVVGVSTRKSGSASIRRLPRKNVAHSRVSGNPVLWPWVPAFAGTSGDRAAPQSLRAAPVALTLALLDRLEHAVGRHWQIVETDADRVSDGIGEGWKERRQRTFAGFLGAEGAVRIVALDDANFDRR